MFFYILRRIAYAVPIIIGVNVLTFALFFMVNSPDDMARAHLGGKYVAQENIEQWKASHGYDKPLFFNAKEKGLATLSETLFFDKSFRLFFFDFGQSDQGRDVGYDIRQRMQPSLALAIPVLLLGLFVSITFALFMALFRATVFDAVGVGVCIAMMSVSGLFYIIGGQYLFGKVLRFVPISGYQGGWAMLKFLVLPIVISVVANMGAGARWYRILFLEEVEKEYVRTARSKGLSEIAVMFRHVLKNAMIPILTGIVAVLPLLFMGSLLMESFFSIPGLGSYTIDAIRQQDFAIVRAMVFLGTVFYILGLILTDISYTFVDPRVRLR